MDRELPRLLVATRPDPATDAAVERRLPGVPWAYLVSSRPDRWGSVEAVLLGPQRPASGRFDPYELPRLSFVQSLYAGLDGTRLDELPRSAEVAGNVGAYAPFVAEHALALALAASRSLIAAHAQVIAGRLRPAPEHRLLFDRTAVILGYGAIGRAISERLAGFHAQVLGLNRSGRAGPGAERMFASSELRTAVAAGDVVFDARPLTRSTRGSIGTAELEAMKPDAIYVNVGRAAVVQEEALYRHLVAHPDFRAALDVWWNEDFTDGTLRSRFPFASLPNVVATPHSAGYGPGVLPYVLDVALENLARFFRGERPLHIADRSEYGP